MRSAKRDKRNRKRSCGLADDLGPAANLAALDDTDGEPMTRRTSAGRTDDLGPADDCGPMTAANLAALDDTDGERMTSALRTSARRSANG